MESDLFTYVPHRNIPMQMDAAHKMRNSAKYWQFKVLQRIIEAGDYGITRDELVLSLGADSATLQPRISTLKNIYGKIKDSGMKRANRKGNMETAWVAV